MAFFQIFIGHLKGGEVAIFELSKSCSGYIMQPNSPKLARHNITYKTGLCCVWCLIGKSLLLLLLLLLLLAPTGLTDIKVEDL